MSLKTECGVPFWGQLDWNYSYFGPLSKITWNYGSFVPKTGMRSPGWGPTYLELELFCQIFLSPEQKYLYLELICPLNRSVARYILKKKFTPSPKIRTNWTRYYVTKRVIKNKDQLDEI